MHICMCMYVYMCVLWQLKKIEAWRVRTLDKQTYSVVEIYVLLYVQCVRRVLAKEESL